MFNFRRKAARLPVRYGLLAAAFLPAVFLLSGCGSQSDVIGNPAAQVPLPVAGMQGRLMGGQQPVTGSTVQLLNTGTGGYGFSGSPNIVASTTTDASGSFVLPAYTCNSATAPMLLVAKGGNPGLADGTNNSAIFEVSAVGPCGNLTPSSFFVISEVTTVAAAYALRPFVSATTGKVGTSSTNATGLAEAMLTARSLADPGNGAAPGRGLPAGMTVPVSKINSLANSLAACVNSTGPTSTPCANLFSYSGVATTGATANVFSIAVAIATAPSMRPGEIYAQAGANPPFQPTLTSAPSDWAMPITFTSGNLNTAHVALDIDATGNIWVATNGGGSGTVEELSNHGVLLKTNVLNNFLDAPGGLAIDTQGRIGVTSSALGDANFFLLNSNGTTVSTNNTGLSTPTGVAFDAANFATVTDAGAGRIFKFDTTGAPTSSVASTNGVTFPAFDAAANLYVTGTAGKLERYAGGLSGTRTQTNQYSGPGKRIAFDSTNFVWATNTVYPYTLEQFNPSGTFVQHLNPFSGGSSAVRLDGAGEIWVGNPSTVNNYRVAQTVPGVNAVSSLLLSSTDQPVIDIGIDFSGNVWLANGKVGGLVELVGAGNPLTTPVSVAAATNKIAQRP